MAHIDLYGCPKLTFLLIQSQTLQTLDLTNCTGLNKVGPCQTHLATHSLQEMHTVDCLLNISHAEETVSMLAQVLLHRQNLIGPSFCVARQDLRWHCKL